MSYTPTNWKSGDVVTSAKLNKLEQGVVNAGGALLVETNTQTGDLNKTWAEINAAAPLVWFFSNGGYMPLVVCYSEKGTYYVSFVEYSDTLVYYDYATNSESGYPAALEDVGEHA